MEPMAWPLVEEDLLPSSSVHLQTLWPMSEPLEKHMFAVTPTAVTQFARLPKQLQTAMACHT